MSADNGPAIELAVDHRFSGPARRSHRQTPPTMKTRRLAPLAVGALIACAGEASPPIASSNRVLIVDEAVPPRGVPDRQDDPAVVAVDVGGDAICAGALIAQDMVVTERTCVAGGSPSILCPAGAELASLHAPPIRIFVSDPGAALHERASARDVLVASGGADCRADLAFVLLDTPIDDIAPLSVRPTGAAKGERLRTVSFDNHVLGPTLAKLVRDHLSVLDATATELTIGEPCWSTEGGPAVDETTGNIVGIASRAGGGKCTGLASTEIYVRTDTFLMAIGEALSKSAFPSGTPRGKQRTRKGPVDMGANCARGDDCAAGVCVEESGQEYCSRTCGPHDRCPAHFLCQVSPDGLWACVEH